MRLTRDEILLIAIIFAALLIGAAAKQYRIRHRPAMPVLKGSGTPAPLKKPAPVADD
jgi:hypothetical protein